MTFSMFRSAYSKLSDTAAAARNKVVQNKQTIHTALQWYNFTVAVLVTADYIRNMNTENAKDTVEYGIDIAVHLLQWSLSLTSAIPKKFAALAANGYRTVDIPLRMFLNKATVPGPIAVVDALNHFVNTMDTTVALLDEPVSANKIK